MIKIGGVRDGFARRLSAMPTYDFRHILAKLDVAAHYVSDAAEEEASPLLILMAGIHADVCSLRPYCGEEE
jgi:hypothetical protein